MVLAGIGAVAGAFIGMAIALFADGLASASAFSVPTCPGCGSRLPVRAALGQACPGCGEDLGRWRSVVVLGMAVFDALTMALLGLGWSSLLMMVTLAVLWCAVWTDVRHRLIPDRLVLVGGAAVTLVLLLDPRTPWPTHLEGLLALFTGTLALAVAARGGFGGGDVKLSAFIGLAAGLLGGIVAFVAAGLTGGLYAAVLLALRHRRGRDTMPFGPFLALGGAVGMLVAVMTVHR